MIVVSTSRRSYEAKMLNHDLRLHDITAFGDTTKAYLHGRNRATLMVMTPCVLEDIPLVSLEWDGEIIFPTVVSVVQEAKDLPKIEVEW